MKIATVTVLVITVLSSEALAFQTPQKGRNRMPGDEGFANQWFRLTPRVTPPNTAFGFIPLTPAPDARPPSYQVPHKKRNE